jgi:ribosomal protein S18 acetylase RimI-like enzyme
MVPSHRATVYEILQLTDMFTLPEINVAMELIDVYLFNKEQKDYLIYVAIGQGNEVVGYICYGPTPATEGTFDIYWIAVSPAIQKRGIGRELLVFAENEIQKYRGRMIIIETSSQQKYFATQQFYQKNGYIIEARIKDFYRSGDDKLIFIKRFNVNGGSKENGKMAATAAK